SGGSWWSRGARCTSGGQHGPVAGVGIWLDTRIRDQRDVTRCMESDYAAAVVAHRHLPGAAIVLDGHVSLMIVAAWRPIAQVRLRYRTHGGLRQNRQSKCHGKTSEP